MAKSHLLTGPRLILYVNGAPFAQAVSFEWDSQTPSKEVRGVDSMLPVELAPTTGAVSWNLSMIRLEDDGGVEGAGIQAPMLDLPSQLYFSMILVDRRTDVVVFQADRCRCDSQSWQAPAKGLLTGRASGRALDWNNEIRPVSSG